MQGQSQQHSKVSGMSSTPALKDASATDKLTDFCSRVSVKADLLAKAAPSKTHKSQEMLMMVDLTHRLYCWHPRIHTQYVCKARRKTDDLTAHIPSPKNHKKNLPHIPFLPCKACWILCGHSTTR